MTQQQMFEQHQKEQQERFELLRLWQEIVEKEQNECKRIQRATKVSPKRA